MKKVAVTLPAVMLGLASSVAASESCAYKLDDPKKCGTLTIRHADCSRQN